MRMSTYMIKVFDVRKMIGQCRFRRWFYGVYPVPVYQDSDGQLVWSFLNET